MAEKESARDEHKEKMDKLAEMAAEMRSCVQETQAKVGELMRNEGENKEKIFAAGGTQRTRSAP